MSRENVDTVRALLEAYRNPEVMALLANGELDLSLADPEIEWDASRLSEMIPDLAEVYHGHEGVRTYWRRWFEAWKDLEFEVEDVLDAGADAVALIRNQRQWGRHTGIRWRTFPDQESALAETGLSR